MVVDCMDRLSDHRVRTILLTRWTIRLDKSGLLYFLGVLMDYLIDVLDCSSRCVTKGCFFELENPMDYPSMLSDYLSMMKMVLEFM
jgi:hypothetical protein